MLVENRQLPSDVTFIITKKKEKHKRLFVVIHKKIRVLKLISE